MLALRTSPPIFSIAEAERIARDIYGLAVSASPLSGERDCNFHLRTADSHDYVLKIFDLSAGRQTTDCQIRVLEHLAEQDPTLPVPRLVATQQGAEVGSLKRRDEQFTTCLVHFLPGRPLSQEGPSPPPESLYDVGTVLARIDRALRGFFHPALAQRLAWDVRQLPELAQFAPLIASPALRGLVEGVAASLRERLPTLRGFRSQAIHGDCHGNNVLVSLSSGRVSGVLDFGDMIHAPLILEAAVAMSELLTDGLAQPESLTPLLEGYVREMPLQAAEIETLFELITARHAASILLHAWRDQHDHRGARILDDIATRAAVSLERLLGAGRADLTQGWHVAAGTAPVKAKRHTESSLLSRRHRLMGAGAELFYEKPLHIVRARGVWLYDADDAAYLDVYNNVPHVGHTHPAVVGAIQRQTALLSTHTRYLHSGILDYAERLTATLPAHLDTCIFVNSGSEANDVAWRIAQMATGHKGAVVMANAYHGVTEATAALTPAAGQVPYPRVVTLGVPPPLLTFADSMGFGDLAAVRKDVDRAIGTLADRGLNPAAFFLDTAITSSGIFDPPAAWMTAIASRVRAAGGLVVADEVQYGLGRSGSHLWGFARRGLSPDIVTLGKPVGNGYPLGVVIAGRDLIEAFQKKFGFFSTFGGNPVAAAAGLAVLDVMHSEGLMAHALATGAYLRLELEALAKRHASLSAVRGAGLLFGVDILGRDVATAQRVTRDIVNHMAGASRVLIGYEGPLSTILKLRPPMPFGRRHVERLIEAIDAAATAVERGGGRINE